MTEANIGVRFDACEMQLLNVDCFVRFRGCELHVVDDVGIPAREEGGANGDAGVGIPVGTCFEAPRGLGLKVRIPYRCWV